VQDDVKSMLIEDHRGVGYKGYACYWSSLYIPFLASLSLWSCYTIHIHDEWHILQDIHPSGRMWCPGSSTVQSLEAYAKLFL